jgi:hypothetical protein
MSDGLKKGRGLNSSCCCNRTNKKPTMTGRHEIWCTQWKVRNCCTELQDSLKAKSLASQGGIAEEQRWGSEFKTWVRSLFTNSWSIPLIKFYDCDNSNKRISLEKNLNHSASIREGPYVHRSSIVRLCYCLYYKRILTFHFLRCKKQDAPCKSQLPWLLYLLFFFLVMCSKEAIYVETMFPVYITQHRILMILFHSVQESRQRSVPVLPEVL